MRRREDVRLLTGRGRYTDDLDPPGCAQAVILRSPHAHARIVSIGTAVAKAAPGVLAVLTGRDAEADGIGPLPTLVDVPGRDVPLFDPKRAVLQAARVRYVGDPRRARWLPPSWNLQAARVRYVGDPVVLVVAETRQQALDAAELVEVEYDPLPAVTNTSAAAAPGAPVIWEGRADNTAVLWDSGRFEETEAAFAQAHRVVSVELVNNRMVGNPMEPRVALGE
ncbi:xanthine dehydrogenase family protein molybdopterin-binding subunit [Roseomonas harenae]|uniref:xanthine dehydrogenase family protein molybdopterin-binding subunit n=1 Tax=Muricoccus harenae TaxID=2692566 RepID=UPI001F2E44EC|nr:hypothetical protein [Roseomonas harenae]